MRETTPLNHPVTPEIVYARTLELANNDGRNAHEILPVDYERAKQISTYSRRFSTKTIAAENGY